MTEIWEYTGPPCFDEIQWWHNYGNPQSGYRPACIVCGMKNTHFIRQKYWICHNCGAWFTIDQLANYRNIHEPIQRPLINHTIISPHSSPTPVNITAEYDRLRNLLKRR